MASKVYVKLRDTGTTFHDIESGVTVVRDKVTAIPLTARVQQAIKDNILDKVDKDEAKKALEAQEAAKAKKEAEKEADVVAEADAQDEPDTEEEDEATEKPAVPKKKAVAPKR